MCGWLRLQVWVYQVAETLAEQPPYDVHGKWAMGQVSQYFPDTGEHEVRGTALFACSPCACRPALCRSMQCTRRVGDKPLWVHGLLGRQHA